MRDEQVYECIHRLARLNQQHNPPGALENADQFLDRMGANDLGALGVSTNELVYS